MNAFTLFERDILFWVQENLRTPALTVPMRFVSTLGNAGIFWIALTLLLLAFRKTRRTGIYSAAAILLTFIIVNIIIKPLVARVRPYDQFPEILLIAKHEIDFCFPSGHASNSFASAWAIYRVAPKKYGIPAVILAFLISISRVYVAAHYPSDVIVGVIIGIVCAEICVKIVKKQLRKYDRKHRRNKKRKTVRRAAGRP